MKFSEKLDGLMQERNWKQADLVRASGMSDVQIFKLCTGKTANPSLSTLVKLVEAFEITPNKIMEGVDITEKKSPTKKAR